VNNVELEMREIVRKVLKWIEAIQDKLCDCSSEPFRCNISRDLRPLLFWGAVWHRLVGSW